MKTCVNNWLTRLLASLALAGCVLIPGAVIAQGTDPDTSESAVALGSGDNSGRKPLSLEQVVVSGNSRLKDSVILGTLDLTVSDTLNADILEAARLRLLREHDVLKSAEFATRPGSSRGMVILDVSVEERKAIVFETGYGQHDVYGWFLTLLGVRSNPASTSRTELGVGLRLGFQIAGVDGKFERRASSGGLGFGANFHVYNQQQIFYANDVDTAGGGSAGSTREFAQDIGRVGAELYLLQEPQKRSRFTFGYRVEEVRPESTFTASESGQSFSFTDFPPALQPDIRRTTITGLFLRYVRDTRDLFAYPRSGFLAFVELQSNNTWLGGDEQYSKARMDVSKHFGLGNWRVFSTRLAGGVVSRDAPYHERFYVGGVYTVRGFRELSLSPPSGHDGFAIASGELRFPLISAAQAPPRLSGLVFVDAGIGWRWDDPPEAARVESAAGYGMRLRLPWLGTLGLDVGVPFTDGRTGDRFYVHGVLGFSF
jgi:outer membrane protein assembly factor BamA